MDIATGIEARRAVKSFDPAHEMSDSEVERLLSLTALSPTAFNLQHWRFVVVSDPELRRQIRAASWNQSQVTDCSLLVVLCADLKAWERDLEGIFAELTPERREGIVAMIRDYYTGKDEVQRDEALRSCGLAAATMMLAAKEMGYDSCPMDGFDFAKVAELIHLPDDHLISMFIAVGKALEPVPPRSGRLPLASLVIANRFGS